MPRRFPVKAGFERADYHEPGRPWRRAGPDQRAWGWAPPPFLDRLAEECRAVRERVGLIDLSSFGKSAVEGAKLCRKLVDTVPEKERVRAISTFTMFFEIGTASGALVLGTMADLSSKRTAFLGGAAFCAVGLVVLWKVAVPRSRVHVAV